MSYVEKFVNFVKGTEFDYDETDNYDEYGYREEEEFDDYEEPKKEKQSPKFVKTENEKVLSMNTKKDYEIVYNTPQTAKEVSNIAKAFKEGRLCIVNVANLSSEEAQTLADFMVGAAFALNGIVKSISDEIFVAIPSTISYRGDFYEDVAKYTSSTGLFK